MSQQNVDLLRDLTARWNAGQRDVALMAQYLDPDIELRSPLSSVVGEPYRGYAGMERWMHDLDDQFSRWTIEIGSAHELGDGRVLTIAGVSARGRASGAEFEFDAATEWELASDRRVRRIHIDLDVRGALEAAGLGS